MKDTSLSPNASPDVFPEFAIPLNEANARIKLFQQYVREYMQEGEDYGIIPGTTKPTLLKPGAEKLNAIFGYAPTVEVTNRHEDWDKGFVAYEVKVTLINKRTGHAEAEGIGSCNSRERKYARQDAAGIANTVLKMAKKRALVDATLSATRASGLFEQDAEDMEYSGAPAAGQKPAPQRAAAPRPAQPRTAQPRTAQPRPAQPKAPAALSPMQELGAQLVAKGVLLTPDGGADYNAISGTLKQEGFVLGRSNVSEAMDCVLGHLMASEAATA